MGISPFPLISSYDEVSEKANRSLRFKKHRVSVKSHLRCMRRRPRSILTMKRRGRLEGSRWALNPIRRKVKTLKKLVPNKESMGLDGLFKETAEYIMCLQMRVKVMQVMVKVLTGSNDLFLI